MKKQLMVLLFGTSLVLGACGGGEETAEPPADGGDSGSESSVDAEAIVQQNCISCHGESLEGSGNFPPLNDVGARLSEEEIRGVIDNGKGTMPADIIEGDEADAVAKWLAEKK